MLCDPEADIGCACDERRVGVLAQKVCQLFFACWNEGFSGRAVIGVSKADFTRVCVLNGFQERDCFWPAEPGLNIALRRQRVARLLDRAVAGTAAEIARQHSVDRVWQRRVASLVMGE